MTPELTTRIPGLPKTDKLDAQWLARLTELGLLRASFVPPKAIRALRDYTRARTRLVQERTRCYQRLEKLLEGAWSSCRAWPPSWPPNQPRTWSRR